MPCRVHSGWYGEWFDEAQCLHVVHGSLFDFGVGLYSRCLKVVESVMQSSSETISQLIGLSLAATLGWGSVAHGIDIVLRQLV